MAFSTPSGDEQGSQAAPDPTPAADGQRLDDGCQLDPESQAVLERLRAEQAAEYAKHARKEVTRDVDKWKPWLYTTLGDLNGRAHYLGRSFPEAEEPLAKLASALKEVSDVCYRKTRRSYTSNMIGKYGEDEAKVFEKAMNKLGGDLEIVSHILTMASENAADAVTGKRKR